MFGGGFQFFLFLAKRGCCDEKPSLLAIGTMLMLFAIFYQGMLGSAVAQPEGKQKKAQWDYAELSVMYVGRMSNPESHRVHFTSRESNIQEIGWTNVAQKLGIETDSGNRQLVFDYLGSEGWELVAATAPALDHGQPNYEFYWQFKRERP